MITRVFHCMLLSLLFAAPPAYSQSYGTELPFVLGTGARVTGMGVAGVSVRGDASIQYYNPSGTSYLEWRQFVFFRSVLFDSDVVYHTVSYAHPLLNYGTFGFSVLRLDISGIEERDPTNQLLSSDLHNTQTRLLLGYSKHVTSSLAGGVNIKVDNQSFGSFSGSGVGVDVGISATQRRRGNSFVRGFRQGFVIQNLIEPSLKLNQDKVADPMQIALGFSVLSSFGGAYMETAIDLVNPRFSPFRIQIGQEIRYIDKFSLRFGLDDGSPAYGLGARYKSAALDYAYRNTDLGGNHQFSVSIRFGASLSEQKSKARARLEREVNDKISLRMDELERTQIQTTLQKGDSLFARREYGKALGRFESALLWQPGNKHAEDRSIKCKYHGLMDQAGAALTVEDYVQGLFFAKQALELVPQDPQATAVIERCNQKLADLQSSAQLANSLLKTAIDFYASRQYAKALAAFDELLRLDPGNELAREYRKKCLLQIEEIVHRHRLESHSAAGRGDYVSAIESLRRLLAYKPSDAAAKARIAELERENRQPRPVPAQPQPPPTPAAAQEVRPTVDTSLLEQKYSRGMEFFNKGDFDGAVGLFTEIWAADPSFHDVARLLTKAYLLMGMRFYSRDDYASAIEVWKKALTIDPDNVKVRRYLSRTDAEFRQSKAYDE
ncbi:MAG: PorV/PorQ family protein [Candidatus Krumholzibacteria bacterium]|nr:PorV/PorQ family protein [Candidatus Krumholzibacteria bacterium]